MIKLKVNKGTNRSTLHLATVIHEHSVDSTMDRIVALQTARSINAGNTVELSFDTITGVNKLTNLGIEIVLLIEEQL